ncbi:MAG: hypothetical protein P8L68_02665 [Paracoccaceae bacterium]|nr:hypothetical protein [Paracoccaceae bacterium]
MDEKKRLPVFLERSSYRRRRARDASRVLPVLSLFLFAYPGLWALDGENGIVLSDALYFLFAVWCIAIIVAAILSRYLSEPVIGEHELSDLKAGE